MKRILTFTLILASFLIKPTFATNDSENLIKRIQLRYQELEDFSCTGKIQVTYFVNDFVINEYAINFTIKLKKPDNFLIHWKSDEEKDYPIEMDGAIWSEGGKYFYYQKSFGGCVTLPQPEQAFSIATGVSLGITYKIPSLFFGSYFKKNWLDSFKEPYIYKYDGNSVKITGVDIDSESIHKYGIEFINDQSFIKNHWSKTTEPDSNKKRVEELKNRRKEIEENKKKYEMIFTMSNDSEQKVTVESILRDLDEEIQEVARLPENEHMAHYVINETFENISTRNLNKEDFRFCLPSDVVFKGEEF